MAVARDWGKKSVFNEYGVSVWEYEKILATDCGGGCTTIQMFSMPLNCTFKND